MNPPPRTRVPLYERLPEIYRLRDTEVEPPGQLAAFLGSIEEVLGAIDENIEALYHDLFIDTCDDWVTPYLGDLLGVSALKGPSQTLRADVADTIALRRRKGTLAAIERLVSNLTGWGAHVVELRERLAWTQHLNHQRPDAGGEPPYRDRQGMDRFAIRRGGTMPIRDPASLALLGTAFDPAARLADFKAPLDDTVHPNLPNLAVYLWRLATFQVPATPPFWQGRHKIPAPAAGEASYAACFDLHPLSLPSPSGDRPIRLFNTGRYDPSQEPPDLTTADEAPAPILRERLSDVSQDDAADEYVTLLPYTAATSLPASDVGLKLFVPQGAKNLALAPQRRFRGENLCAWEAGLPRKLGLYETIIDPDIGRLMFGVATVAEANALRTGLLASYTYGSPGPVGAHPIPRDPAPKLWPPGDPQAEPVESRKVKLQFSSLADALADLHLATKPVVIEIGDSDTYELDLTGVSGAAADGVGQPVALRLAHSLVIRAASGQRPVIRLAQPLAFRPADIRDADPERQAALTAGHQRLTVRLEGLFLARSTGMSPAQPLIQRAALGRLEILGCTLDPGGHRLRNGDRAALFGPALRLPADFGFSDPADRAAFAVVPFVVIQKTITGGLELPAERHRLSLEQSIVDAGRGPGEDASAAFAITGSGGLPADQFACATEFSGVTCFGRLRVFELRGRGGIFAHRVEVQHNQRGCVQYSCFEGLADRLPQHHACVDATEARLLFTSAVFGDPGYAQLARTSDRRLRERGPGDDAMGAYGFLLEAHRWANLHTRLREFLPVGVRPLLLPLS